MANLVKVLVAVLLCYQDWCIAEGATPSSLYINHSVKAQQNYNEYETSYATESYDRQAVNYSSNFIRQPTYQSKQKIIQQTNHKNFSHSNPSAKKQFSSYAAPASGSAPYSYSMPQRANLVPLPKLFPQSLVDHLSSATAHKQEQEKYAKEQQYFEHSQQTQQQENQQLPHQQHQYQQQQQHREQIQPQHTHYFDTTKLADLPLTIDQPLLMVQEPTATLVSPNQSRTLEAARTIAAALLQASGETTLDTPGLAPLSHRNALDLPNPLNSTDVVIVKSQKNAYIIPKPLAKDARNPAMVHALYQMRDQLEKAYTINQFIFIIKPEKINFLNKLV